MHSPVYRIADVTMKISGLNLLFSNFLAICQLFIFALYRKYRRARSIYQSALKPVFFSLNLNKLC